jgi:hypothetical protein
MYIFIWNKKTKKYKFWRYDKNYKNNKIYSIAFFID